MEARGGQSRPRRDAVQDRIGRARLKAFADGENPVRPHRAQPNCTTGHAAEHEARAAGESLLAIGRQKRDVESARDTAPIANESDHARKGVGFRARAGRGGVKAQLRTLIDQSPAPEVGFGGGSFDRLRGSPDRLAESPVLRDFPGHALLALATQPVAIGARHGLDARTLQAQVGGTGAEIIAGEGVDHGAALVVDQDRKRLVAAAVAGPRPNPTTATIIDSAAVEPANFPQVQIRHHRAPPACRPTGKPAPPPTSFPRSWQR